ncbi:hypothetical protein [Rhodobacter lacus]|uniref:Uncharacterized protein n=1 Tax=Rhodobacter lacus TaxID=1641972 RepID=A0ABW5ADM6_9RHOB
MLKAAAVLILIAAPALAQPSNPFDPYVTCLHQDTDDDFNACYDFFLSEIRRTGLWCRNVTDKELALSAAINADGADPNQMTLYPGADFAMLHSGPTPAIDCHYPIQLDN